MLTTLYERRAAAARARGWGAVESRAFRVSARIEDGRSTASLHSSRSSVATFVRVVEATRQCLFTILNGVRNSELCVEAGVVQETLRAPGQQPCIRRRPYLLVLWRGAVLCLSSGLNLRSAPPAAALLDGAALNADLPVVFGPSAVLALIEEAGERGAGPLVVKESSDSPYPPSGSMLGRCSPQKRYILSTPDYWTSPLSALPLRTGSWRVRMGPALSLPPKSLLVDSLVALGNGPGPVEFEAEFHVREAGRIVAVGERPLVFRADARRLLRCALGASGPARAAVVTDPIAGWRFGYAQAVVSSQTAATLLRRAA